MNIEEFKDKWNEKQNNWNKCFYNWSNNKRKMHGYPMRRGRLKKKSFYQTNKHELYKDIENIMDKELEKIIKKNVSEI